MWRACLRGESPIKYAGASGVTYTGLWAGAGVEGGVDACAASAAPAATCDVSASCVYITVIALLNQEQTSMHVQLICDLCSRLILCKAFITLH